MISILAEDINEILADKNIQWNQLKNRTVLITGAAGLIGGMLARTFAAANTQLNLNIRLLAHARNIAKIKPLLKINDLEYLPGDIRESLSFPNDPGVIEYIFHCAAVTQSTLMTASPVEVIETMVKGTRNMLELARVRKCRSFLYLSSMEVYGQTNKREVFETDLGYLNLSDPRSCYPESKRLCELLCTCYLAQYALPMKIARLAQTFGAGTPRDDTRVFAQFARSALAGRDIELHTQGASRGNYCYLADTIRALLIILLSGQNGETYNVVNPSLSMTIRELAELAAQKIAGGKIKTVVNIPSDIAKRGYAPDVGYTLSAAKLEALGWTPKYGRDDMFGRMAADWAEW